MDLLGHGFALTIPGLGLQVSEFYLFLDWNCRLSDGTCHFLDVASFSRNAKVWMPGNCRKTVDWKSVSGRSWHECLKNSLGCGLH